MKLAKLIALYFFTVLVLPVGFGLLTTHALGAPVPTHLMKPAPDPVKPGLVFQCSGYLILVVRVEGQVVTIDSATHRGTKFMGGNEFRKCEVLEALRTFQQPTPEEIRDGTFDPDVIYLR